MVASKQQIPPLPTPARKNWSGTPVSLRNDKEEICGMTIYLDYANDERSWITHRNPVTSDTARTTTKRSKAVPEEVCSKEQQGKADVLRE